jgi:Tfp pilus assembly protein PilP
MPTYYKKVEAVQIVLTEEHKETLAKKQLVEANGVQIKKAGEDYFALVNINHSIERYEIGDYLIFKGGRVQSVVKKDVFEKEYIFAGSDASVGKPETPVVDIKAPKKVKKQPAPEPAPEVVEPTKEEGKEAE